MPRYRRRSRADYNRAVDLVRKGTTTNEFNETVESGDDETVLRLMAKLEPARGAEGMEGDRLQATHTHVIRIPHTGQIAVTTEMAIRYNDGHRTRTFDISSVADAEERHDELVIEATERR